MDFSFNALLVASLLACASCDRMTLKEFASKGGKARAAKLSKDERVRIARDAGLASAAKQRASKSNAKSTDSDLTREKI